MMQFAPPTFQARQQRRSAIVKQTVAPRRGLRALNASNADLESRFAGKAKQSLAPLLPTPPRVSDTSKRTRPSKQYTLDTLKALAASPSARVSAAEHATVAAVFICWRALGAAHTRSLIARIL